MDLNPTLVELRAVIGYLGEKDQLGWWQSSFFTRGSSAFLSPLFTRTQFLAQVNGVCRAAALVHDERIGVGHVYHLFRLPEDLEQSLHRLLHEKEMEQALLPVLTGAPQALDHLRQLAAGQAASGIGPIRLGDTQSLRAVDTWRQAAACYLQGLETQQQIFPYFTDAA